MEGNPSPFLCILPIIMGLLLLGSSYEICSGIIKPIPPSPPGWTSWPINYRGNSNPNQKFSHCHNIQVYSTLRPLLSKFNQNILFRCASAMMTLKMTTLIIPVHGRRQQISGTVENSMCISWKRHPTVCLDTVEREFNQGSYGIRQWNVNLYTHPQW